MACMRKHGQLRSLYGLRKVARIRSHWRNIIGISDYDLHRNVDRAQILLGKSRTDSGSHRKDGFDAEIAV
jgi:hypothetical protein